MFTAVVQLVEPWKVTATTGGSSEEHVTRGQDLFGNHLTFLLFFVGFFFLDDLQPRARGGQLSVVTDMSSKWVTCAGGGDWTRWRAGQPSSSAWSASKGKHAQPKTEEWPLCYLFNVALCWCCGFLRGEVDPLCGATVNPQPLALITPPPCQRMLGTCHVERQTCTWCSRSSPATPNNPDAINI